MPVIDLRCKQCNVVMCRREGDVLYLGGVSAKAPADLMCQQCGTVNNVPVVPSMTPAPAETATPVKVVGPVQTTTPVTPSGTK